MLSVQKVQTLNIASANVERLSGLLRAPTLNTKTRRKAYEYRVIKALYRDVENVENNFCIYGFIVREVYTCKALFSTAQHAQH